MTHRVITIFFSEFSVDPDGCAGIINEACRRKIPMRVVGAAQEPDRLVLTLEQSAYPPPVYNFAPLEGESHEELIADISGRYYAGFSMICGFRLRGCRWALFAGTKTDSGAAGDRETESGRCEA